MTRKSLVFFDSCLEWGKSWHEESVDEFNFETAVDRWKHSRPVDLTGSCALNDVIKSITSQRWWSRLFGFLKNLRWRKWEVTSKILSWTEAVEFASWHWWFKIVHSFLITPGSHKYIAWLFGRLLAVLWRVGEVGDAWHVVVETFFEIYGSILDDVVHLCTTMDDDTGRSTRGLEGQADKMLWMIWRDQPSASLQITI